MKDKYFAADIFIKKYLIIPYIVENTKTIYYASGKKIILQWNFIFACLILPSLISNKMNGKAKNKKYIYMSVGYKQFIIFIYFFHYRFIALA